MSLKVNVIKSFVNPFLATFISISRRCTKGMAGGWSWQSLKRNSVVSVKTSESHTHFLIWSKRQQICFALSRSQSLKAQLSCKAWNLPASLCRTRTSPNRARSGKRIHSRQILVWSIVCVCVPHLVTVSTRYTSPCFEDLFISINRCRFVCNSKTTILLGTTALPKLQIMTNRYKSRQCMSSKFCMVLKAVWMISPHIMLRVLVYSIYTFKLCKYSTVCIRIYIYN